jgi:hypothetical protein
MLLIVLAQIFQGITLIKIAVAVLMVVGLSVLAERVSTRFAGVVSGYPLGADITLYFYRLENVRIDKPLRLNMPQLMLRALFSAAVIILITASAGMLGPDWAGLMRFYNRLVNLWSSPSKAGDQRKIYPVCRMPHRHNLQRPSGP